MIRNDAPICSAVGLMFESRYLTTCNQVRLQRGRTAVSLRQPNKWSMTWIFLCVYAQRHATQLSIFWSLNICPHRILKDKALEESFTSEKPKVSQFCIFSCAIYTHVLEKKRTNFEPFIIKGIFIGYSETLKAYWICIPVGWRTIIIWDDKFDEDGWSLKSWLSISSSKG